MMDYKDDLDMKDTSKRKNEVMKKYVLFLLAILFVYIAKAEENTIVSPDGKLIVTVDDESGKVIYSISYKGKIMLEKSALGLKCNTGDFSKGLALKEVFNSKIDTTYRMSRTKAAMSHYKANELRMDYVNNEGRLLTITFRVSDNDVAYRYSIPAPDSKSKTEHRCVIVEKEFSSFRFPEQTTSFLCPQIGPMTGWARTKPSYEEEYQFDAPINSQSRYGYGYTFPCLFRIGQDGWVLISETGVGSNYCGSHLSDYDAEQGYIISYPDKGENNGLGSEFPSMTLPGNTPWRTITVGTTLAPIVETTIPFDLVEPMYEPAEEYKPGHYTWSWLVWQDNSINYNDQIQFIDLAATMGYEYCLVDGWWDKQIGRDRIVELSEYAGKKGVKLFLWYNSNGYGNDAPQTPKNCMNTAIAREREMKWLRSIGVKGIKVDFFGGDKQETMRLYEDILSDANRYGLQVIFHGCTIPRGWERMYPNYVGSEAVLASENVYFFEYHAKCESRQLTMHPFSRNAIGSMDWGGVIMNRYMSRDNKSRHKRKTTDMFEIASAIVNQCSVQGIAVQPNNLSELPQLELDLLKQLPAIWDETRFIDGYPGRYVILARRHLDQWYIVGLNAMEKPLKLGIHLPMLADRTISYYTDKEKRQGEFPLSQVIVQNVDKQGNINIVMQPNGGFIIK